MISTKSEYVNCNLCGADDTELVFVADENQFHLNGRFNIVKCKKCGLVYVNPRPRFNEIHRYYPDEIYYSYQDNQGKKNSFRQRFKNFLLETLMGEKRRNFITRNLIVRLFKEKLMVVVPSALKGKILDIGCGNGEFLSGLQKYGWDTYGVEISPKACEIAKRVGINVFCGELFQAKYTSEFFDVIVMNQILEHVHSPSSHLKEINRILKPKGLLIISVPNIDSFESKIFKEKWTCLDVPRHLYHFNLKTLTPLLQKHNFEIIEVKSKVFGLPFSGIRDQLRKISIENNHIPFIQASFGRTKFLFLLLVLKPFAFWFAHDKKGFGSYISVSAQKMRARKKTEVMI